MAQGYFSSKLLKTTLLLALSAFLPFVFGCPCHSEDECVDDALTVEPVKFADHISFIADLKRLSEATIDFNCDSLLNLQPDHPLPYRASVRSAGQSELLRLTIERSPGHYGYGATHWHWHWGVQSNQPPADFVYSLPYSPQEHHRVIQSYYGTYSHKQGTPSEFAIDFDMRKGTKVCAARDGIVVAYRDDSNMGGSDPKFDNCANYVIIKHADGTYGDYEHLKRNGVLVKLGDQVTAGQPIGLSGATGHVGCPHLHFAIVQITDAGAKSIPFKTRTAFGVVEQLDETEVY